MLGCCVVFILNAQDESIQNNHFSGLYPGHYLETGSGISFIKVRDEATSPLLYRNLALPNVKLGLDFYGEKTIIGFHNDFVFGNLRNHVSSAWYESPLTSFYITSHLEMLFNIKKAENELKLFTGPAWDNLIHFRVNDEYGNSGMNYDILLGLGIAGRMEYPIHIPFREFNIVGIPFSRKERQISINWQLNFPLLNLLFRPAYGTILYPLFDNPDNYTIVDADNINAGIVRPFYVRSEVELNYYLQNYNFLQLAYAWDFFSFNPGFNKVQTAYHGIMFSYVFRFNQSKI